MDDTFHNKSLLLTSLSVSIFVLGYVVGPLLLAPLSEIYGRRFVLTGANVFFCVWQIGAALSPNLSALIVFRFLAGIGGSGCLTIGGGVIADLFHPDRRGLASSVYSLGPLFGPVVSFDFSEFPLLHVLRAFSLNHLPVGWVLTGHHLNSKVYLLKQH